MQELIIDGKTYISSKRAAEITGYAKDYVGQLCREGRVQARLVGRSWYVLEDSIRAHRFGEEDTVDVPKASPEPEAWNAPRYMPETAPELPDLPKKEAALVSDPEERREVISDMQEAWQEWFNKKQAETQIAVADLAEEPSEEVVEPRQAVEEEEEVVMVTRIGKAPREIEEEPSIRTPWSEIEETVTLRRSHSSMPFLETPRAVEPRVITEPQRVRRSELPREKKRSSVAMQALLLSLAGLVVAATVIGSGYADSYIDDRWQDNVVFKYLVGESTVVK